MLSGRDRGRQQDINEAFNQVSNFIFLSFSYYMR